MQCKKAIIFPSVLTPHWFESLSNQHFPLTPYIAQRYTLFCIFSVFTQRQQCTLNALDCYFFSKYFIHFTLFSTKSVFLFFACVIIIPSQFAPFKSVVVGGLAWLNYVVYVKTRVRLNIILHHIFLTFFQHPLPPCWTVWLVNSDWIIVLLKTSFDGLFRSKCSILWVSITSCCFVKCV